MKLGFQMAAAVIALAGWAGSAEATTVTGSGTTNILGPIGIGDTFTLDTTAVAGAEDDDQ